MSRPKLQAVGYVRVSTEDQATEGVSLAAQRAKIAAWCEVNDAELAAMHSDDGLSGCRADNRAGLQAAIAEACKRGAVLVVYSISRVARSTRDTLEIADRLKRSRADLASISERIDTTSAAGKMVFRMLAVLAEFERDQVSERTAMALAHKRQNGQRYTRIAPYGYRWEADRLVDDPAERRVLARIQRWRADGWGYKRIAVRLNEQGVHTRKGTPWLHTGIRNVLSSKMRATEAAATARASRRGRSAA